jgi:hypothetical protein
MSNTAIVGVVILAVVAVAGCLGVVVMIRRYQAAEPERLARHFEREFGFRPPATGVWSPFEERRIAERLKASASAFLTARQAFINSGVPMYVQQPPMPGFSSADPFMLSPEARLVKAREIAYRRRRDIAVRAKVRGGLLDEVNARLQRSSPRVRGLA